MQYLNRGCTCYFATKDTDQKILQNRKSPEVKYLFAWLITEVSSFLPVKMSWKRQVSQLRLLELPQANWVGCLPRTRARYWWWNRQNWFDVFWQWAQFMLIKNNLEQISSNLPAVQQPCRDNKIDDDCLQERPL